jgi:heterodisulfide reductase subunit C
MTDFGFSIDSSKAITIEDQDNHLLEMLHEIEPDIYKCMACGSCTASCPAGVFVEMNLRKVLLSLQRGREKETLKQLKSCMLCGKCNIVCPRGINTRNLILSICKTYNVQ